MAGFAVVFLTPVTHHGSRFEKQSSGPAAMDAGDPEYFKSGGDQGGCATGLRISSLQFRCDPPKGLPAADMSVEERFTDGSGT